MMDELEKIFLAAANPEIARKQSAYMRNLFPFLGLTKPQRELLEKQLIKKELDLSMLKSILARLWEKEEREFQYTALCLSLRHKKIWTPATLSTFESMIRNKSWWDTVDVLAANHVGLLVKTHLQLVKTMDKWIADPYLWIRRTALLFQLRWKKETDEERLFEYCKRTMHEKDFFIRKAIGWALREYSKTHPKAVEKFIDAHRAQLSNLSIREGSKYL